MPMTCVFNFVTGEEIIDEKYMLTYYLKPQENSNSTQDAQSLNPFLSNYSMHMLSLIPPSISASTVDNSPGTRRQLESRHSIFKLTKIEDHCLSIPTENQDTL